MTLSYTATLRVFFGILLISTLMIAAGINGFPGASAENTANILDGTTGKPISVMLKSQNTPVINLRPGQDLPTEYDSGDYSSYQFITGQNRPLALASADFDVDGFPDLVTGYAAPNGGILTFHKGNPEAFAPQSEESQALIKEGRFPDPFLQKARSYALPAAPDFLVTGDFNRDGNLDVITAARGGDRLYFLAGNGTDGGFQAAREIGLSGRITALTAGEIDASDNRADLLVGIESDGVVSLLVFEDSEKGVFAPPAGYKLTSPAVSLEIGKLDDDLFGDTAILTADGVSILHGRNQRAGYNSTVKTARMEKLSLPFVPQALTLGEFIFDRAGKTEMALLAADGTVQIAKRGELDERPFSVEESRENRRLSAERHLRGEIYNNLTVKQTGVFENWTIADSINAAAPNVERNIAAPVLMKANLSGQNTDDILFLDSATREIKILSTREPERVNGEAVSFAGERSVYTLEAENQPTAMLSIPLNIFVRPGLIILQDGKSEPSFVPAAPTATFTVTKTADTNDGACNADCSLREAITAANGAVGADMITLPAGTYTLTIPNSGGTNEDNNATGDLDIKDSITINGAGQATTIVQGGTTNANGIDKVFASNPVCTSPVSTSMTGLTVRFGRNAQANGAADFSNTGGGMDWCNIGTGGTLTVTNSTFDSNTTLHGYGAGIDTSTDPAMTSGSAMLTNVTISNNTATVESTFQVNGGGLSVNGQNYNLTVTNSTISGNKDKGNGGGIYISTFMNETHQLNGITVSGNSASSSGGGIALYGFNQSFTLGQSSVVSGNTSGSDGTTNGSALGGGIFLNPGNNAATVNKTTVINNILSASATSNQGGAGIYVGAGPATISFSRIVGNTGTTAAIGTGLRRDNSTGAVNAVNNWWGCNTGPSAAPCDTAVIIAGSVGSLTTTPWLRYTHTASPTNIVVGQTSTLTASFLTNSNNQAIAASNLDVLIGLPAIFNTPVRGTISGSPTTIQATGTATATFTGTSVGAGSANAVVDNGTATATITIAQAATTTAVTSSANPSVFGQNVTFTASISVAAPGSGTPTGTVQFKDGATTIGGCGAVALSGGTAQCATTALSIGSHTITAVYSGDANFTGSTSSPLTQTVNKANTTTTITADAPDPSVFGQNYAVTASVAVIAPGTGTPTGTITVSDGTNSCTITLPATSCNLPSTSVGAKTLTATYNGDTNFNTGTSAGVAHTVSKANTTTTINSNSPNPSIQNAPVTVTYSVAVTSPGAGTLTGNVTVSDGVSSCTGTVAAGSCMITLTTSGARTLTATYNSDANFNGSTSAGVSQTVNVVTAASVEIGGRVFTQSGRGVSGAKVTITDQAGSSRTVSTTTFGYFRLTDIQAGETYIITVSSKRYRFTPQVVNLTDNLTDLNFTAQE